MIYIIVYNHGREARRDEPEAMPRKASSISEIDQLRRVRGLLNELGVAPPPLVEVLTATGKTFSGQLWQDVYGNTLAGKNRSSYGMITLLTTAGMVEIDYLDIVVIRSMCPPAKSPRASARPRARPRRRRRTKATPGRRRSRPHSLDTASLLPMLFQQFIR